MPLIDFRFTQATALYFSQGKKRNKYANQRYQWLRSASETINKYAVYSEEISFGKNFRLQKGYKTAQKERKTRHSFLLLPLLSQYFTLTFSIYQINDLLQN